MSKNVQEFTKGGEFIGDFFNYTIFELLENQPPRIYITASPFDMVSKKAPEQALVYHDGKLESNIDYIKYVAMRTGVMDAIVLQAMGVTSLKDKRVIMYGTGQVAQWSLTYLKEVYPDLAALDVTNSSGQFDELSKVANDLGITLTYQKEPRLEEYDFIFMHTSAEAPVLSTDDAAKIKKGAVITTYRTSTKEGELASEFFDSQKNNVIVDWENSLAVADLAIAQEKGVLHKEEVTFLVDLLRDGIDASQKTFTVFRSMGTPMQDVATIKIVAGLI